MKSVNIFKIVGAVFLIILDVVLWILYAAVLKDTARIVVLVIAIIFVVALLVWAVYEIWKWTQGMAIPEEVKSWGTEDCIKWSDMYIYREHGEVLDKWISTNMENHGKERTPIFTSTLTLKSNPDIHAMVVRADRIDRGNPVQFSYANLEEEDKWGNKASLKEMIEAIIPDKIPVSRNVSRKRDPVTGKVTEELLREDRGYDEEDSMTFEERE